MVIEVENNVTNSLAVIADTSSGMRFAWLLRKSLHSRRCRVRQDTNRAPFKIMSVRCHLQGN